MGLKAFRTALLLGAAALGLEAASAVLTPAYAQETTRTFAIEPQELDDALREFGRQTGRDILFAPDAVAGKRSPGVEGEMTARQALEGLLAGTGLRFEQTASNGYAVQDPNSPTRLGAARRDDAAPSEGNVDEEIVVIGTNIRGVAPVGSPVDVYTAEAIERMGVTTTQGFVERLPQNLGTRTQYSSGLNNVNPANVNYDAATSVDLRGLGAGTTLTLLNGRRLSPSDFGQAVDVSMIPVGAIERVEILTDGASAIYGADAIGGVVNFVLRDDFEGAETRANYGGVTDGHLRQGTMSQTFGERWAGGYGVLSYNYYSASALEREDRAYAAPAGPGTLTPIETAHAAFLTLSQRIGDRLELSGDFGFSRRATKSENTRLNAFNPLNDALQISHGEGDRSFVNLSADYEVTDAIQASLTASYSESDLDNNIFSLSYNRSPQTSTTFDFDTNSSVLDVTAKLDGELWRLLGGIARFSVGAGVLDEQYEGALTTAGLPTGRDLSRRTTYAFAELFAPLVREEQNVPFMRRLEVSLAGRYTGYDDRSSPPVDQDFGDAVDPKFGVLWTPVEALDLRGTYGTSFRAPALMQTDPTGGFRFLFPLVIAGAPAQNLSVANYPDNLQPETAETYTLGFDFRPDAWRSFRLSGTYYNISYTDRIGVAPTGNVNPFLNPELVPDAIYRAPSAAYIEQILGGVPPLAIGISLPGVDMSDTAAVAAAIFAQPNLWIVDSRTRNLALSEQDGFDLSLSNTLSTELGEVAVGANVTRILSYHQQGSPTSPVQPAVGFVGQPADLRGRIFATLTRGGATASVNVNYVDETKLRGATGAITSVDEWITTDVNLSYQFERAGLFDAVRLSLSATNVFDEDPPFVNQTGLPQIGFDPANANPLGRMIVVGLTTQW